MTQAQINRIQKKIKQIKAALAADKKRWGGFHHDGRGLRYLPPALYIQAGDYTGGLRYLNWFQKNFEDDSGFPDFLFAWTIILFKRGKLKEAEKKAFETFCSNTYIFDKFFGRPLVPIDKYEGSNLERPEGTEYLTFSHDQPFLAHFTEWLDSVIHREDFSGRCRAYIEIYKKLKDEDDVAERRKLFEAAWELENEFNA